MSFDSLPPAQPPQASESSDLDTHAPLDLRTVFSHPAGLRTARYIVASYIRASQHQNPKATHNTFSSVSPPTFDSSPEVASLLSEILAFSESGSMVSGSDYPDTTSLSPNGNLNIMVEAASTLSSMAERSRPQHSFGNSTFASHSPLTYASTNPYSSSRATSNFTQRTQHPQLPSLHSLPTMEVTSTSRASGSSSHGTESPYNVESPSGQSSAPSMSRQSSGRPANSANLPNPEFEPLCLDQSPPFSSRPSNSQAPVATHGRLSNGGYFTQLNPHSSATSHLQTYNSTSTGPQSRFPSSSSPHIKNFLPVNKAPSSNSMAAKKDSLSAARAIAVVSRAAPGFFPHLAPMTSAPQPSRSTALISPRSGINQPLSNPNENTAMESGSAKKRKPRATGTPRAKRQKSDKPAGKSKKGQKEKEEKPIPASQKISGDLWLRIIEFSPPSFLKKVRLLNKSFKDMVDKYDSLYVNQRMENFGADIPVATMMGLTERQYTNLLGGKGCLEPGCDDTKASRTHWSWAKRWCTDCWRSKIEREDRILKARQHDFPQRQILTKLLECIPIGMHDSFMKAHDYIENLEARPSTAPRIYKYYLKAEVDKIIEEYQSFKPPPFKDDPTKSAAENALARTEHQQLEAEAVVKQSNFLDERKEKNTEHMQRVLKIEGAIRMKRQGDAQPYNENRKARRELFVKRAGEDLPDIPEAFIVETKAFKAATRIFRDPGTERGWQTLKPKIQKEWDDVLAKGQAENGDDDAVVEGDGVGDVHHNGQSQDGSHIDSTQQNESSAQNNQPSQMGGGGHQQVNPINAQHYLPDRVRQLTTSGIAGMFGSSFGGNYGGGPAINGGTHGGTTISGLQSAYSNPLQNSMFYNGSTQFQSQLQQHFHQSLHHMASSYSQSFQGSYMHLSQGSINNNNNFYGSGPPLTQPGDRKITVNSLLAPAPAPGHNFDGFQ